MLVKVGKKYQVRIPMAIRDELALTRDTKLVARQNGDSLELSLNEEPTREECSVTIRDRFQFTLPSEFRRTVGITENDMLALQVAGGRLIVEAKLISKPPASLTRRVTNAEARPDRLAFVPSLGLVQLAKRSKLKRKKSK